MNPILVGCTVPKKKRAEICKTLDGLWWDESKELRFGGIDG